MKHEPRHTVSDDGMQQVNQLNITNSSGQDEDDKNQCAPPDPDHVGQAIRMMGLLFALLILMSGILGLILILVREL